MSLADMRFSQIGCSLVSRIMSVGKGDLPLLAKPSNNNLIHPSLNDHQTATPEAGGAILWSSETSAFLKHSTQLSSITKHGPGQG